MTDAAKQNGLLEAWKKDSSLIIICWFNETLRQLETLFAKETTEPSLFTAQQVHHGQFSGKNNILFAEHYPLRKKEEELFERLNLAEVLIHSSLDEPLFAHFGGVKIVQMMKQLGMKESDSVQHKMISQSILGAQEKIEKKITAELSAGSQSQWMELNFKF